MVWFTKKDYKITFSSGPFIFYGVMKHAKKIKAARGGGIRKICCVRGKALKISTSKR